MFEKSTRPFRVFSVDLPAVRQELQTAAKALGVAGDGEAARGDAVPAPRPHQRLQGGAERDAGDGELRRLPGAAGRSSLLPSRHVRGRGPAAAPGQIPPARRARPPQDRLQRASLHQVLGGPAPGAARQPPDDFGGQTTLPMSVRAGKHWAGCRCSTRARSPPTRSCPSAPWWPSTRCAPPTRTWTRISGRIRKTPFPGWNRPRVFGSFSTFSTVCNAGLY